MSRQRNVMSGKPLDGYVLNTESDQAQGLVGWWPGLGWGGRTLRDLSGLGNHGTCTNMSFPSTSTSGWGGLGKDGGKCLAFDGTNDYVSIAAVPANNEVSLSCWVYLTSSVSFQRPISSLIAFVGIEMYIWVDGLHLQIGLGSSYGNLADGVSIPTNSWLFVCATYANSVGKIYRNGRLTATTTIGSISARTAYKIGSFGDGSSNYWPGLIDDPRIYNRALTASQVAALYDPATRWELRWVPGRILYFGVASSSAFNQASATATKTQLSGVF